MGVIRVAIFLLWWYRVPWPMVLWQNLRPRVCCSHMIVPLGACWYLGMCECDSTAPSFSRNPYSYPSPLSINYLEESYHMCIASWLLKQESTQPMNNLEQECLEQNPVWSSPFSITQVRWERLLSSSFVKTRQCYPYLGICLLDKLA